MKSVQNTDKSNFMQLMYVLESHVVECSTWQGFIHMFCSEISKLMYLYIFTDCFMKISPQSSEQIHRFVLTTEEKSDEAVVKINADKFN